MTRTLLLSVAVLALVPACTALNSSYALNQCEDPRHYFDCGNGHCVRTQYVCDFKKDCSNNADESYCPTASHPNQYQCKDRAVIAMAKTCDGVKDCSSGSDETLYQCRYACAGDYKFHCSSVTDKTSDNFCVGIDVTCDGKNDCPQGEDEQDCPSLTYSEDNKRLSRCEDQAATLDCGNGQCVLNNQICDRWARCHNYADESNCPSKDICSHENQHKCKNGRCLSATLVCTGYNDCKDDEASDEAQCPPGCSGPNKVRCSSEPEGSRFACLEGETACDGYVDCPGGEDEPPKRYCPKLSYHYVG